MALTAIYLAAGASSRFGGKIKALVKLGPNDENLLQISMKQAKKAGFDNFIIIVSDKTIDSLKECFGDYFEDIPIRYAIQKTPEYREKPFGTSHALLSAKDLIKEPFIVINSDDIYGDFTFKAIADYMKTDNIYCLPGYRLKNVLADEGGVNRGVISIDENDYVKNIVENFDIKKQDIPSKFTGEEFISMNFFGLQPDFLEFLEEDFKVFLEKNKDDPKKEWLLPGSVSDFKIQKNKRIKMIPTPDVWIGVTHPEDEAKAREKLRDIWKK
jgi:NDP-sugar pyrophosphorylase family protein